MSTTKWITGPEYVNLRKTMSTTASYLERIPNKFPVAVLAENLPDASSTNWAQVTFNGKTGYILQQYLTATNSGLTHPTSYRQAFGFINLKQKAGTNLFVKNLQICLKQAGLYSGSIDGVFGANTKTAVQSWQGSHNLDVDGIVGQNTMQSFWSSYHGVLQSQGYIS